MPAASTAPPKKVAVPSLDSFLDSLVFDYQDVGKEVQLSGKSATVIDTPSPRPAPGIGESDRTTP